MTCSTCNAPATYVNPAGRPACRAHYDPQPPATHKETTMTEMSYRPAKHRPGGNVTPLKEKARSLRQALSQADARNRKTPGQATAIVAYKGFQRVHFWELEQARKGLQELDAQVNASTPIERLVELQGRYEGLQESLYGTKARIASEIRRRLRDRAIRTDRPETRAEAVEALEILEAEDATLVRRVHRLRMTGGASEADRLDQYRELLHARRLELLEVRDSWHRVQGPGFEAGYQVDPDGDLLWAPVLANGELEIESAGEVAWIETQAELDEVNRVLGTSFSQADFPGR